MRRRVGILGGTFDPPHRVHVEMARVAADEIPLDVVLFMPAPRPPHKVGSSISSFEMRVGMVRAAIQGDPRLDVSLLESQRQGPSYTVELLEQYCAENRRDDVFLLLGADSVQELGTWKNPQRILQLATLVVFPRPGFSYRVPVGGDASVVLFEKPVVDLSSTEIRRRLADGLAIDDLVPPGVRDFILDNSLYT